MTVKLLSEQHLECLSYKEATQARLSLFMSKCHIVANHMTRLTWSIPMDLKHGIIKGLQCAYLLHLHMESFVFVLLLYLSCSRFAFYSWCKV